LRHWVSFFFPSIYTVFASISAVFHLIYNAFLFWGSQEVSAEMLQFLQDLRKVCCLANDLPVVISLCEMCSIVMWHCVLELFFASYVLTAEISTPPVQVVTVGVVGGSDLIKIKEQLGKTGTVKFSAYSSKFKLLMK
jgi:hypothetical protein